MLPTETDSVASTFVLKVNFHLLIRRWHEDPLDIWRRTWSLIPTATWPTLTWRRSRILRHSPPTFSIQMSTPASQSQSTEWRQTRQPKHSENFLSSLPSKQYEDAWLAEANHSRCLSVWLLHEEKTPELRSSDEWSESWKMGFLFLQV